MTKNSAQVTRWPAEGALSARGAFTLVELLVVIAIIALLVSILLMSLRHARDTAKQAVCHSNMKQIATAMHTYAGDNDMQLWESGNAAPIYRFWYAVPQNQRVAPTAPGGPNPVVIGPAFEYLSNADKVWECPTNKRRTRTRFVSNPNDPFWQQPQNAVQRVLWENFLSDRALNFDYTMVTGAGGAPLGATVFASWDERCRMRGPQQARALTLAASTPQLKPLHSVPVYVEEDPYWWNEQSPDGLCSNWDEVSEVHFRKGHMAFLDGSALLVDFPVGSDPNTQNDFGDLAANDLYVSRGGNNLWYQLCPTWPGPGGTTAPGTRPYGWLKTPRP
ncbi:MAG: type II secretion system protein [Phycisphaerales bacterium]